MYLLPRLSPISVNELLERAALNPEVTASVLATSRDLPVSATFAASGGTRVPLPILWSLRSSVEAIAREHGWPERRTTSNLTAFDEEVAVLLAGHSLFDSGEALRDDVWAYIATSLLFHITRWRFRDAATRYQGGIRNTFQRLWIRAQALDRGEQLSSGERWILLHELTEDALVAITERPSIASDRTLAVAIAEGWVRCKHTEEGLNMESVMRRASMQLRLLNETRMLSMLSQAALQNVVDREFLIASRRDSADSLDYML